jgi:hypothetical protein
MGTPRMQYDSTVPCPHYHCRCAPTSDYSTWSWAVSRGGAVFRDHCQELDVAHAWQHILNPDAPLVPDEQVQVALCMLFDAIAILTLADAVVYVHLLQAVMHGSGRRDSQP